MKRWLTLIAGVGIAAAALYALLARPPSSRPTSATPAVSAAPHEEIDDASRARLEHLVRDATAREERGR